MKDTFNELVIGDVLDDEFSPETEIFRSCMRSFFRDKHGNDPVNIRRLYKERIVALHKVKIYQVSHAVESEGRLVSVDNNAEVLLNYSHE